MKRSILIICLSMMLPAVAGAQELQLADFAYGIRIDTVGQEPVQAIVLPAAVYENLTRSDLGDLRVFNDDGQPVPHALHQAAEVPDAVEAELAVPFFPVYGASQASLGSLGVQVQRMQTGTLVRIDEQAPAAEQSLRAYIVDASQVDASVNRMEFVWDALPENLMVDLSIESSNDLTRWQPWGERQTLTSMRYNESVLVRNVIDLPARRAQYYRLSWQQASSFPPLGGLKVTTTSSRPEYDRLWASVDLEKEDAGVFTAAIPVAIPADRVEIELPEVQTIVRVRVESSERESGPWTLRHSGLAYNLQAGDQQWRSASISVYRNAHRYWRLTVDEGSGVLLGTPSLRFGWTPARVLFVAQGSPPYTLAFGSASAEPAGFESRELFGPVSSRYDDVFDLPLASPGPVRSLGGEARLEAPAKIPWQQIALWGSMLLGIAILGTLALRLMRGAESQANSADDVET